MTLNRGARHSISGVGLLALVVFSRCQAQGPSSPQTYYVTSGLPFAILNPTSPGDLSPQSYAISGIPFSILNSASPATISSQTYAISGLRLSVLNRASPGAVSRQTYAISGLTFSIANKVSLPRSNLVSVDPAFLAAALARGAETKNGKPVCTDSDGDGLCDSDELIIGTNPFRADTDGDGYPDGLELRLGSDPLDPKSIPDIRPPGYYATPPVGIHNTISILGLTPR